MPRGRSPAVRAPLRGGPCLDVDFEHRAVTVRAQHHDVGQVDEDRAGARRVLVHEGSRGSGGVRSRDSGGPRLNSGGSQTLLTSEVPSKFSTTDLDEIQRSLNGRPRKTFGYMIPQEKLAELVALSS